MYSFKSISTFFLLIMLVLGLRAQNGTAVVSEMRATDLGNGMAKLEVRISGNQAGLIQGASFSAQPADGNGIGVIGNLVGEREVPVLGGPRDIILFGNFPYTPSGGNGPDFYDFTVSHPIIRNGPARRMIILQSAVNRF